uniref:Fibronectin type-III domain-containing protein n=1 Tax=candidate division WOR-3 bacterium TaxID=2052148 RepID=A0A7C2K5C7_UNCW3
MKLRSNLKSVLKLALALSFLVISCQSIDTTPPAAPTGLTSVTGDRAVYLYWNPNTEKDLAGYRVYRNTSPSGYFKMIAEVKENFYVDRDVENGITYFYAVSAFDSAGNESELSEEDCFDTPRPEGYNMKIYEKDYLAAFSGYSFKNYTPTAYDSPNADFYFDVVNDTGYIVTTRGTLIQDMGAYNMDDISYAPLTGWDSDGVVEAISGHVYVVWTRDNHFAKFRIKVLDNTLMVFDWAYQVAEGNRELVKKNLTGSWEVYHD